ncbi:MAG TPA: hypothetical protein VF624_17200 [Tepidisphaeraceae bacterium]|jgi:hypothetical protein
MATTIAHPHVRPDSEGILRVGGIKYIMFVFNHVNTPMDAAALQEQYPMLSIAEIYDALAYYYDNKSDIDAELERRERDTEEFLRQHPNPPGLRERLVARLTADQRTKLGL